MRGLNLLLRRPPDASPRSWTALTSCRGSASCNVRKALVCRQFRSFYCRSGHIPNVRYSISGPPHPRRSDIEISFLDSRRNCAARCRSAGGHMKLVMISLSGAERIVITGVTPRRLRQTHFRHRRQPELLPEPQQITAGDLKRRQRRILVLHQRFRVDDGQSLGPNPGQRRHICRPGLA